MAACGVSVMFSLNEFQTWEIVAISGVYAVVALALAVVIGTAIAYSVIRNRVAAEQTATVHGVIPADVAATEKAFEATPAVVLG